MSLVPLATAPLPILLHASAALIALLLGIVQFVLRKGSTLHRLLGWLWVLLMAAVAAGSFSIHTICSFGGLSPIHLLSAFTLVALPIAVLHARRHRVVAHRRSMMLLFAGALVIAGGFTLLPGRLMHDVVFGTATAAGTCRGA